MPQRTGYQPNPQFASVPFVYRALILIGGAVSKSPVAALYGLMLVLCGCALVSPHRDHRIGGLVVASTVVGVGATSLYYSGQLASANNRRDLDRTRLENDLSKQAEERERLDQAAAQLALQQRQVNASQNALNVRESVFRDKVRNELTKTLTAEITAGNERYLADLKQDKQNLEKLRQKLEADKQAVMAEYAEKASKLDAANKGQLVKAAQSVMAARGESAVQMNKAKASYDQLSTVASETIDEHVSARAQEQQNFTAMIQKAYQYLEERVLVLASDNDRLQAEIQRLREPKRCTENHAYGRMAQAIHAYVETLTRNETIPNVGTIKRPIVRLSYVTFDLKGDTEIYIFDFLEGCADDLQGFKNKMQQSLRILGGLDIKRNELSGLVEFHVRMRVKTASATDKELSRLVKPAAFYLAKCANWDRAKFFAPSESGKTSSAEILGYQWAQENNAERVFHYPNKKSVKNYITAEIKSKGTDECVSAFIDLVRSSDEIQDGKRKESEASIHHVFDDSDSVLDKAINAGLGKNEILDFFTRASHGGIAFCLIGHSTAANRVGGMTHSDFDNLVRIYSGGAISTMLKNTQSMSRDRADKLLKQYEKIRDAYEVKNNELGLHAEGSSADPGAFRFALVIEPNKSPYFVELPALDYLSAGLPQSSPKSAPEAPHKTSNKGSQGGKNEPPAPGQDIITASDVAASGAAKENPQKSRKYCKCGGVLRNRGKATAKSQKGKIKYTCSSENHKPEHGPKTVYYLP